MTNLLETAVMEELWKYNLDSLYPHTLDDLKIEIRTELLGIPLYIKPGLKARKAEELLKEAGIKYGIANLNNFKSYDPDFEPLPCIFSNYGEFHGLEGIRTYITLFKEYAKIIRNNLKVVKVD